MFVSLTARGLSTIPDNLFCYSAISSAGVVTILPGFTIRKWINPLFSSSLIIILCLVLSALELTSRNILCGSVRMVYAIIYTLFLVSSFPPGIYTTLMLDFRVSAWQSDRISTLWQINMLAKNIFTRHLLPSPTFTEFSRRWTAQVQECTLTEHLGLPIWQMMRQVWFKKVGLSAR